MKPPIYKPSGRALEYSPDALALNIYTGCPHRCYYCFAPSVLRKGREDFHSHVEPRKGIVEAVKRQFVNGYVEQKTRYKGWDGERKSITSRVPLTNKIIHLCFTCDPYPMGCDTSATREIIKLIKETGNHVQILTKGDDIAAERDFDLLDNNDWFGITYTGLLNGAGAKNSQEPDAAPDSLRFGLLQKAKKKGINTWLSCEPVLEVQGIYISIRFSYFVDLFRIGKLNYHPSGIDWSAFGHKCVELCEQYGRAYYIKDDLRKEMEK